MIANLKSLLAAIALCALTGCREEDPITAIAESDFRKENPEIGIVESGIRSRAADRVVVYVRFVHTPASAFPPKAGIWERELLYAREDGKWQHAGSAGDKYVRPAR